MVKMYNLSNVCRMQSLFAEGFNIRLFLVNQSYTIYASLEIMASTDGG